MWCKRCAQVRLHVGDGIVGASSTAECKSSESSTSGSEGRAAAGHLGAACRIGGSGRRHLPGRSWDEGGTEEEAPRARHLYDSDESQHDRD